VWIFKEVIFKFTFELREAEWASLQFGAMADLLASSGDDSDNDLTIKVNESYAEHYNK
jgi:hypothetical protein